MKIISSLANVLVA